MKLIPLDNFNKLEVHICNNITSISIDSLLYEDLIKVFVQKNMFYYGELKYINKYHICKTTNETN